MRAPTMLRKKASAHCTAVPVGARIARPFIPDVITTLREDARRVIGATAKPLYAIDGKAVGLDRRSPQTSLFEGGGPPAGGGRSKQAVEGVRGRWKSYRISQIKIYASKRRTMRRLAAHFNLISYLIRRGQSIPCLFLAGTPAQDEKKLTNRTGPSPSADTFKFLDIPALFFRNSLDFSARHRLQ